LLTLKAKAPRKLAPLLQPARYKGAFGGRGGAKSHFFAEQVVLRCCEKQTKVVCIREVQESIKDSVKALIEQKIEKLGLGALFDVLGPEIRGPHDSLVVFRGMQRFNSENIKSLEGFDIAWVEEAQTLSDISLRLLRPTIRKENSELWFSWNPRHDTDPVDKLFRGPGKPSDAILAEVNWNDNPWFPDVLKREKDEDYARDPEMADHVWGGNYEIVSEGAYYARLIVQAEKEGRIGELPYDLRLPVVTSWDLGVDDYTAVWFKRTASTPRLLTTTRRITRGLMTSSPPACQSCSFRHLWMRNSSAGAKTLPWPSWDAPQPSTTASIIFPMT